MTGIHSTLEIVSASSQLLWNQLTWSSSFILLLLTSPQASASVSSDSWDRAGPTLVLSSPPPLVCRVCKIWSLGRFQDVRVAIQRIRAPNTTRRTPRMLTKTASGGESLYFGLLLRNHEQKFKLDPLYIDILTLYIWFGDCFCFLQIITSFYFFFNTYRPKMSFSVMPMSATAITLEKIKRPL